MPGKLFVISAPSGAGKSSLTAAVLNDLRPHYAIDRVITYTTKSPRPGEVNGVDYHFISPEEFQAKIAEGFFIEWSTAYGNYYGSPRSIVNDIAEGKSYTMILDRVGAQALKAQMPDAVLVWIHTISIEVLKERLIKRGQDTPEQIEKRLLLAHKELEEERNFSFFNHTILNDSFEIAVKNIKNIMQDAIHSRAE